MENRLVSIAKIRKEGAWYYGPYSQLVTDTIAQLNRSAYPQVKVGDLVQLANGVARGFTLRPGDIEDGIALVTSRNITDEGISLDKSGYISAEEHQKLEKTQLQRGDVLINLFLRPAVAAVYNSDEPANINSNIVRLRLKNHVLPDYLVHYLNSEIGQVLVQMLSTGSVQRILNTSALMKVPIILPPLAEQKLIVERARQVAAEAKRLDAEAEKMRQRATRDLLSSLFNGGGE